jgi:hypothetical protein
MMAIDLAESKIRILRAENKAWRFGFGLMAVLAGGLCVIVLVIAQNYNDLSVRYSEELLKPEPVTSDIYHVDDEGVLQLYRCNILEDYGAESPKPVEDYNQ